MSSLYQVLGYQIHLSDSVTRILESFIQSEANQSEAGGILMGEIRGNDVYVQKITTPNKLDTRTRFSFIRHKDNAQLILNHEWVNSGFTMTYLGEWHTHPEKNPNPSFQDLKMIREQFCLGKLTLPFLILIIQGIEKKYISVFANGANKIATHVN